MRKKESTCTNHLCYFTNHLICLSNHLIKIYIYFSVDNLCSLRYRILGRYILKVECIQVSLLGKLLTRFDSVPVRGNRRK